MPFGLGRPVRSTLTLLILVPHAPLPLSAPPCAYTSSPSPHPVKTAGTPKGAASALDTPPFGQILQVDSRPAREHLANNYGAENSGVGIMEGVARKGCSVLHPHCPVPVLSPLSGR